MFCVVQYPFVDLRILFPENSRDCFFPQQFPRKTNQTRYFRFLGAEKLRRNADILPNGEQSYFNTIATLKFLKSPTLPTTFICKPVFNRLFAENLSLHYDIGLHGFTLPQLGSQFTKGLLNTPRLKVTKHFEPNDLIFNLNDFFEELLRIYQYATSSKIKSPSLCQPIQTRILPGIPAAILSYRPGEIEPNRNTRMLQVLPGLRVGCELLPLNNKPITVWYIENACYNAKSDEIRRLRICISKIHCYKETLRLLLEFVEQGRNDGAGLKLLHFNFTWLLRLAEKERYYGFDNQDFWGLAYSIDNEIHSAQWIEYLDRVKCVMDYLQIRIGAGQTVLNGDVYYNEGGIMIKDSSDIQFGDLSIK